MTEISELKTPCCGATITSERTFYVCSKCKKQMESFVQSNYEQSESKVFTYKELRALAVDFAYLIHFREQGNLSHEKHKELFDTWMKFRMSA